MNAVSLGPLVLSHERLHALIALAAFTAAIELAAWFWPNLARSTRRWSLIALASWGGAARIGYVLAHLDAFAVDPLSVLAFWQGGFNPVAGTFGLALAGFAAILRQPQAVRPVIAAAICAVMAYAVAVWALPVEARGRLPQVTLPATDGTAIPLADAGGRPVVVNLWASWCPPCRREMPMMMDVAASRSDVAVRFANQGETRSTIVRYLESQQLPTNGVVLDRSGVLMGGFGLLGLPSTLFFAADGRLMAVHTGEISRAELTRRIDELSRETR